VSRPRIDLVAPPFAGHLHPLIGIGRALQPLADVRVLSTERAQARIAAAGLRGRVLLPGADPEVRAVTEPARPVGSNPLRLHAQFRATLRLLARLDAALAEVWRAPDERPHLVVADFTLPVAGGAATRLGIPWWTTHPSPCVLEAPGGPPAYLGGWHPGRGRLGRARDSLAAWVVRRFKRVVHGLHRAQLRGLGFPAPYRADGSEAAYSPERVLALGLRELEFARDWPARIDFVGPVLWSPPPPDDLPPPPEGEAVLATLGTHLGSAKDGLVRRLEGVAAALAPARPGLGLHFTQGDLEARRPPPGGRVRRHAWVDYPSWIPRMRAVLHHGGSGVMYECLRAGVPALVHPVDYDQPDHAARLEAAGVALRLRKAAHLGPELERVLDGRAGLRPGRFQELLRPGLAEGRVVAAVRARLGLA